ncbi:hypothetical protein CsSME_00014640 [Camellia sinensis var. sinensis]
MVDGSMKVHCFKPSSHFLLRYGTQVTKVMERVEATFIKHFANSNRRKGLNILRPRAKRERHRVTFTLGLLFGCTIAFIFALVLVTHARNIVNHERKYQYMETMFPLYSLFGFIGLHMLMYAANIYFWKKYRVNYPFIFGFKEGTELGCKDVLLLSFGVVVFAIAGALANLAMEMDPKTQRFEEFTELVPQALLGVTLHDFFLADQLTSQCLRRLYEERDAMQGINALKYFSTIIAVTMMTAYELKQGIGWKTIAFISSLNATIFGTYWDLVIALQEFTHLASTFADQKNFSRKKMTFGDQILISRE